VRVRGVALRGDPREELVYKVCNTSGVIIKKVEDVGADVLVIGSRGMGAMKRVFVGSTSDRKDTCLSQLFYRLCPSLSLHCHYSTKVEVCRYFLYHIFCPLVEKHGLA
jgi:hypothetical protein